MSDLNLTSPADLLPADLGPLLWIAGGVAAAFTLYILLLLPFALAPGKVGEKARAILKDLFELFHHALEAVADRRGRR